MGIYLNPSNANFTETLKRPIFVDKTMILRELNRFIDSDNHYICVSRPRRFGKTIASDIITSYYSKGCTSKELFSGLKISKNKSFDSKLNKYNFIKIDLNSEFGNCRIKDNVLGSLQDFIIEEFQEQFPSIKISDGFSVAQALDESHIHVTSNRSYNNEDALQCAIYLSYIYALNKYTIVKEMTAGRGFADVTFIPFAQNLPTIIIELKHDKDENSALNQIKEKKYFSSLEQYSGNLIFVGINYNEKSKKHKCKIEKFKK